MKNLVENAIVAIFEFLLSPAAWFFNQSLGTNQLESIEALLHLVNGSSEDINLKTYYLLINAVFIAIRPLGYALITSYFLITIFQSASKDTLTVEGFTKHIISLIVTITIAGNAQLILNALLSIGESALKVIIKATKGVYGTPVGGGDDLGMQIAKSIAMDTETGIPNCIGALLCGLLVWLLHQIVVIGVDIAAFSRLIDIGWRMAMTPVGIADCFDGGVNSPGVKYFKSLAAAILAGAVMYIIAAIGFSVAAGILMTDVAGWGNGNMLTKVLQAEAVQLATVGACISAPNKSKELIN